MSEVIHPRCHSTVTLGLYSSCHSNSWMSQLWQRANSQSTHLMREMETETWPRPLQACPHLRPALRSVWLDFIVALGPLQAAPWKRAGGFWSPPIPLRFIVRLQDGSPWGHRRRCVSIWAAGRRRRQWEPNREPGVKAAAASWQKEEKRQKEVPQ